LAARCEGTPERFSLARTAAVFIKEFQQMLRDRLTFAMAVGVPVQLVLFGYAINTDPKGLPTAVVAQDSGPLTRSLVAALQNTGYFRVVASGIGQAQADALLARGDVQFVVVVPPRFGRVAARRAPVRGGGRHRPQRLGQRAGRAERRGRAALAPDLVGPLRQLQGAPPPYEVRIQRRYNPEGLSRYNIVPGLIGTILTMTMVMLTALAMTRERERGTMENLLATPVPAGGDGGQDPPYVVVGYVQLGVILLAAWALFQVPMVGSFALLMAMIGVFILANLAVGFTFSTLAATSCRRCR
jgi:ABC-2 type transport system permease protein